MRTTRPRSLYCPAVPPFSSKVPSCSEVPGMTTRLDGAVRSFSASGRTRTALKRGWNSIQRCLIDLVPFGGGRSKVIMEHLRVAVLANHGGHDKRHTLGVEPASVVVAYKEGYQR